MEEVALALEGKVLQVLTDLPWKNKHAGLRSCEPSSTHLGHWVFTEDAQEKLAAGRSESKSLGASAVDPHLYTHGGYTTYSIQEELTLQAFIRGLQPEQLRGVHPS